MLDAIAGTVFTAGDNIFSSGSTSDFTSCYDPSWGRHKARTRPAVGEKEYKTAGASGYFAYFGAAAGDATKGYYSYDLTDWHVVVLNSGSSSVSTKLGSPQEQWLRADLAANTKPCILAYWHHPLFSSSGTAVRSSIKPLWNDLSAARADIVVNAHYRVYERFAPQTSSEAADPQNGIRQFTVGTGGGGVDAFSTTIRPNSEVRSSGTYGVLELTLGAGVYSWRFIPVAAQTFTDSGSGTCHGSIRVASVTVSPAAADVQLWGVVQLDATPMDSAGNTLSGRTVTWQSDNPGVATVSASGLVIAVAVGSATITATSEGQRGTAAMRVTAPPPGSPVVLVGAGNLTSCSWSADEATAKLLDSVSGAVFTAGDNAYPGGSSADYSQCYDPSWGRHRARTHPAPGDHDYDTPAALGYFGYYGLLAGDPGKGYYSYDNGDWHVISLNSNSDMSAGSPQEQWLRADLAASPKQCTVAYWHHPRFSSGTKHGSTPSAQPLWQALYDAGAEIVISSHEHNYERFAPQTPAGQADPAKGIREFVVGTGGADHHNDLGTPLPNSEVFNGTTWGVLKLTLGAGTYSWRFIPIAGQTFADSGSGSCNTSVGVASVTVSPASASVLTGGTAQLTATPQDSAGNPLSGRLVAWASSDVTIMTVSGSGLVTAVEVGTATITATSGGQSGSAALTVIPVPVAGVALSPATASVGVGATLQLTATPKDANGTPLDGRVVTWVSSDEAVATVSGSGLVTGVAVGPATMTATSEGQSGTAAVTVDAPVASIGLTPLSASVELGATVQLTATPRDATGDSLSGRVVSWASSDAAVATVSGSGLVTGVGVGSATITGTSEGQNGTSAVTVTPVSVAAVEVSPASASLPVGGTLQLTATPNDAGGNPLSGRVVTWGSSDEAVATVSASGLVMGVGVGSATMTATSEGKTGSAGLSVVAPRALRAGYYVSSTGSSSAAGSQDQPWDLATALAGAGGRVQPGDTVWLLQGIYRGMFKTTLNGTAAGYIVFRQYPGERATIDGRLSAQGSYLTFWGFEIMQSNPLGDNTRVLEAYATEGRFINLVLHDAGTSGVSFSENSGVNVELYGSIVYNNGTHENLDHGIYAHNATTGTKFIADNVFFNNYTRGIQIYEGSASAIRNIHVEGNVSFNNGTISATGTRVNLLISAPVTTEGMVAVDNLLYFSPGVGGISFRLGNSGATYNKDIVLRNNYAVGDRINLEMVNQWDRATVENNTFIGYGTTDLVRTGGANVALNYQWNGNTYFRDPTAKAWRHGGTAYDLAGWSQATGLGGTDQVPATTPTETKVFVRPNKYEPGRAHIIVYNWSRLGALSVDVSSLLRVGDLYEVRNVQDIFGPPVVSGTYAGGWISVPMTGVAPPVPIGRASPNAAPRTGPDFDVFLLTSQRN